MIELPLEFHLIVINFENNSRVGVIKNLFHSNNLMVKKNPKNKTLDSRPSRPKFKAQAAAEYLMTYGWAVLVLVIIVAIIAGGGLISPSMVISEKCELGPNMVCSTQAYNDGADFYLLMKLQNSFGYKIKIIKMEFKKGNDEPEITNNFPPLGLDSGDSQTLEVVFKGYNAPVNGIVNMDVKLTYVNCAHEINSECEENPDYTHSITGTIVVRPGVLG